MTGYKKVLSVLLSLAFLTGGTALAKEHKDSKDMAVKQTPMPTASTQMTLSFSDGQWRDLVFDAAHNNRFDLLLVLGKQGLDFQMHDQDGYTLLMVAAGYSGSATHKFNPEMIDYLIAHGARPCARTDKGNTALMIAAGSNNVPAIERLAKAGCSVDEANQAGKTALIYAASAGHDEAVKTLLALGADPLKKGKTGYKARAYASYNHHDSTAAFLEKAEQDRFKHPLSQ